MAGKQHHQLDQRLDTEALTGIFGVAKGQAITEFGNTMLNLYAGIHLHKEVLVAINDTFKR